MLLPQNSRGDFEIENPFTSVGGPGRTVVLGPAARPASFFSIVSVSVSSTGNRMRIGRTRPALGWIPRCERVLLGSVTVLITTVQQSVNIECQALNVELVFGVVPVRFGESSLGESGSGKFLAIISIICAPFFFFLAGHWRARVIRRTTDTIFSHPLGPERWTLLYAPPPRCLPPPFSSFP